MKKLFRSIGCFSVFVLLMSASVHAKKNILDVFKNTNIQNRIIIHEDIRVGDYAIFETASAYGTMTSRFEIVSEDQGVFCMRMSNNSSVAAAAVLNDIYYDYYVDTGGYVSKGFIVEKDKPDNKLELVAAKKDEPGYVPEFDEINFESDEEVDTEIKKLGKKVDDDKVEIETKLGKYIVSLKAYYLKGLSMGREYQTLVIYFTHSVVKFQGFFILQLIEAGGFMTAGVTELVEYGNVNDKPAEEVVPVKK